MHEWTFVHTDSVAQAWYSDYFIMTFSRQTLTEASLGAFISVAQLAWWQKPAGCRHRIMWRCDIRVCLWSFMSHIKPQCVVCYQDNQCHQKPSPSNILPHAIFSHYSGLETGVSVCLCVCADVLTQPSHALSRSVFVFLTSGPVCYVCVCVCCRRPVTAEEEDCICGGTAWLQRGVEILREA